jgi:hypothetical protein
MLEEGFSSDGVLEWIPLRRWSLTDWTNSYFGQGRVNLAIDN